MKLDPFAMRALYEGGDSPYMIAERLGVAHRTVFVALAHANTPMRTMSEGKQVASDRRMAKIGVNRAWFIWQYQGLARSCRDIDALLGGRYADYWLKRLGIPRRGRRELRAGYLSPETRAKIGAAHKGPITSEAALAAARKALVIATPAARSKLNKLWQDKAWKETMLQKLRSGGNTKPNKAEQALASLLHKMCPSEYEYTGDGKIVIAGLIPDFTNRDGQKKVVEMFGNHWHSENFIKGKAAPAHRTERGRISTYASFGYDCLVIWERELKHPEAVEQKILAFHRQVKREPDDERR